MEKCNYNKPKLSIKSQLTVDLKILYLYMFNYDKVSTVIRNRDKYCFVILNYSSGLNEGALALCLRKQ